MTHTVYLPLITRTADPPGSLPRIGIHCDQYPPTDISYQAAYLPPGGAVVIQVWWAHHEPRPGVYEWADGLVNFMAALPAGYPVVAVVKAAPAWAREDGSCDCAPPTKSNLVAFGKFCAMLCSRFQSIVAAEVWNEPAVTQAPGASGQYGCVMSSDAQYQDAWFWAAGYSIYGPMVDAVTSMLGAYGLTRVKVLAGGLIDKSAVAFLGGLMQYNTDPDAITFHYYCDYRLPRETWIKDLSEYIAAIQAETSRPLVLSETNILGDGSPTHRAVQADYIRWLSGNYLSMGLSGVYFYCLADNTWSMTGLVQAGVLTPGYLAYKEAVAL